MTPTRLPAIETKNQDDLGETKQKVTDAVKARNTPLPTGPDSGLVPPLSSHGSHPQSESHFLLYVTFTATPMPPPPPHVAGVGRTEEPSAVTPPRVTSATARGSDYRPRRRTDKGRRAGPLTTANSLSADIPHPHSSATSLITRRLTLSLRRHIAERGPRSRQKTQPGTTAPINYAARMYRSPGPALLPPL